MVSNTSALDVMKRVSMQAWNALGSVDSAALNFLEENLRLPQPQIP